MIDVLHPFTTLTKILLLISLYYKYENFSLFVSFFICVSLLCDLIFLIKDYKEFALYYLLQTLFPWIIVFDKFKFFDFYLKVVYSGDKDIILKDDIINHILDYEESIKKEYESYSLEMNQNHNNNVFKQIYSLHNNHFIHKLKQSENIKITKIINNLNEINFTLDEKSKR